MTSVTGSPDFDYAPGQPNLHLMMRLKQELVANYGLEQGFEKFKQKFGLPLTMKLRETVVEEERAFARSQGRLFTETSPAGEPFVHLPPRVIGAGNHRPIAGVTRSQYVACLGDARVRGRSALIEADGHILLDVQGAEAGCLDDEIEWDPAVFHAKQLQVWYVEPTDQFLEIDEAFTLLGAHTDFFGHWMCEYLSEYLAARLSDVMPEMPVLIDAHIPPSHRASLELLSSTTCSIIEVPAFMAARVRKLWCAPTLSYMPLHEIRNDRFSWEAVSASPARFAPLIREMQQRFDDSAMTSTARVPRIYLARKDTRHRRLVNHHEIEQAARALGFEIIYPEDWTFAEQAAMVRSSSIIIAPEGSAIFLTAFARPGTTLCILSHPWTDVLADYNGLFAPHGIDVVALTGPVTRTDERTPHDSDYHIDEETFRRTAEGLIDGERLRKE